jgi:hypothetical protein
MAGCLSVSLGESKHQIGVEQREAGLYLDPLSTSGGPFCSVSVLGIRVLACWYWPLRALLRPASAGRPPVLLDGVSVSHSANQNVKVERAGLVDGVRIP